MRSFVHSVEIATLYLNWTAWNHTVNCIFSFLLACGVTIIKRIQLEIWRQEIFDFSFSSIVSHSIVSGLCIDWQIHIPNACTFRSLQFRHSVSPVWLTTRAQNDVTQRGNCDMPKWSTIRYYVQLQWSFAVTKRSNEWWWRGTMCASCWCNTRKVEIRFFLRFIPRWISINHVKEKFSLSPRKAIRKIRKLIFVVGVLKWRFWRMELICQ